MILTETEKEVLNVLKQRREKGRETYGQGISFKQGTEKEWIQEAIEEAADLLVYLCALKLRLKNETS